MQANDDTTQAPTGDPQWRVIASDLRVAILDGRYLPGAALPSEPDLARHYGVSRPTVRKAIESLVSEGLVYVLRGRGSFVRPAPARQVIMIGDTDRPDLAAPAYHPDVRAFGWRLARRDWADEPFDSQRLAADRQLARRFAPLQAGHPFIHRHSAWRFSFGGRVEINSYADADLIPDWDDPKRSAQYRKRAAFFYQTIQRQHGPVQWATTTAARLAYEDERAALSMDYADAILIITRAMLTQHGQILEITEVKVPASHFEVAPMSEVTDQRTIFEDPEESAMLGIAFVM
ncbi:GntR family transcriptional regulator [Spirillospora sp. CA-108201]